MNDDLQALETWAAPILQRLQPAERSRLSRSIGTTLRRTQQRRIAAQMNPDGSAYAPRRQQPASRAKAGKIKRNAMFRKLRQAEHLKVRANPQLVAVGFFGRVARIARVHQEGLTDAVSKNGKRITYEKRQLLGFTDAEVAQIRDQIMDHVQGR